jgi:ELWxxDGT repeat protein
LATTNPLLSQVELIAHPDQGTRRSSTVSSVFYEFQGKVFFNTVDQMGYALYCTDGTTSGTICVTRDITPMAFTSCGDWLYVYGSKPQYSAIYDNPWGKYAIWRMKADGTERSKLVDLYRPYSMIFQEFFIWSSNDKIYYSWRGGLSWIDNNSGQVTEYYQGLLDNSSRLGDYNLSNMAMAGDGLFFMVQSTSKENFYFTGLTGQPTVPLALIKTKGSSYPFDNMRIFNNKCYVLHVADSSQLWESDGTKNGTRMVWQKKANIPDASSGPFFSAFIEFQGKLIFDIPESTGDTDLHAIYTFDGNQVQLLYKHPEGWQNLSFVESPDALFVFATTNSIAGISEVWRLDSSGYHRIGTVNCPASYRAFGCWQDNRIIFTASDTLLVLDDSTLECRYSSEIYPLTLYPTTRGIFFNRYENGYTGDPYVLQTSPPSCTPLKKMVWSFQYGNIEDLFPLSDRLFFRANSDSAGKELWSTGGNTESAHLVKEINANSGDNWMRGTNPTAFAAFGNQLVFTATGLSTDYMDKQDFTGLWITDGTDQGTVKLEDLKIDGNTPDNTKVVFQNQIWFRAQSKVYGDTWRLWVSDGHPGGARIFETDSQGRHFERPYGLTVSGNLLWFFAYSDLGAVNLWATDGSEAGTRCIDDLIGNELYSNGLYNPPQMRATGSRLYFTRDKLIERDGGFYYNSREVWVTDGTKSGTQCLADNSDSYSKDLYIKFLGTHNGNLVFTYSTPQDGFELWYSEGDRATTRRLTGDPDTGTNPEKSFSGIASLGDQFFFTGFTPENGSELWVSDGTPDGTNVFMELAHGQQSTRPHDLTVIGDKMVFFCAGDAISDRLWITDGTQQGTEPLPWNDKQLSNIHSVRFWQHALFFVASHPETGEGLYRYELPGTLGTEPIVSSDKMNIIRVYPSPAGHFINIELGDGCRFPMTFKLISSTGSTVKQFTINAKQSVIPVVDLPAGLYLIVNGELMQSFVKN